MKRVLLIMLSIMLISPAMIAGDKKKKSKTETAIDTTKIKWMTLDEVQTAMKKEPRKVFMDVYTDWCGWCKVMDKKTFSNTNVIKYVNTHFYAVKLDAERKDSINFMGKKYGFVPANRANMFAVELLQGRMSYPTSVILEENFQNPISIPGYLDVPTMEKILKYTAGNIYKTVKYPDYEKEFKASWVENVVPANNMETNPAKN